jgi:hypothetical protein
MCVLLTQERATVADLVRPEAISVDTTVRVGSYSIRVIDKHSSLLRPSFVKLVPGLVIALPIDNIHFLTHHYPKHYHHALSIPNSLINGFLVLVVFPNGT